MALAQNLFSPYEANDYLQSHCFYLVQFVLQMFVDCSSPKLFILLISDNQFYPTACGPPATVPSTVYCRAGLVVAESRGLAAESMLVEVTVLH